MKKAHCFFFLFALPFFSFSQDEFPKIVGDTLFMRSGYKIAKGDYVKIGTGSMPDGDFRFIRINSKSVLAYYSSNGYQNQANAANSMPRKESGLKSKVKAVEKRGNTKRGYVYYLVIDGPALINYEVDIENAIRTGELAVPNEFKPQPKELPAAVEIKQQISVADEIAKLKKLYDDGVLTKDEYEAQKKKLLDKN